MGKKKKGSAGGNKVAANTKAEHQQQSNEDASEMKVVILKVNCLCDGCWSRIKKGAAKATLAEPPDLSVDKSKNQVTVKGNLCVTPEMLADLVNKKLHRRSVAVVPPPPPKKEADGEADNKKKEEAQQGYGYYYGYGYPQGNIQPEPVYYPGYPYGYHPHPAMWPGRIWY